MNLKLQPVMLCMTAIFSLGLSACDRSKAASGNLSDKPDLAAGAAEEGSAGSQVSSVVGERELSLAAGPDVCFRAAAEQLGADTKVSEITSFFSAGKDIDSNAREPEGMMTICTVEYQDPKDPRKLVSVQMDVSSGTFGDPQPVDITVAGGDAATFKLEDYLIPLSQVNAAELKSVMAAQKAKLGGVYSRYAWSGVRLSAPGAFNSTHTLRLDLTGRLAANDIRQEGYASVTTDGKTIKTNNLM
ncbi:hypothetical protein LZ518_08545 [Sphingomonas sp. RB56-2]|uniref:Lipoprotein n=1 Tax=Sphingomonas brevis TaxID=2908206 RepID=A0ABT0SA14_9SPHN|nr:hypothetical protein [Sphingomonas brevis]MCL6741177.1 hypothetical protein [Sphingomonas brevis]